MMKVVVGLVVLLVAIVVGLLVFWEVNNGLATGFPTGLSGDTTNDMLGPWNTTNETSGTIFSLLPIVGIIAVAGIMLAYVSRFGGGGDI
jgi:hypothetical protein